MGDTEYILHMFRRLQDNVFDISLLVSGSKGLGKSNTAIYLAMKYVDMYGFVCPNCGTEFYKSCYAIKYGTGKNPYFEIPEYVLNDTANIQCPIQERLDMKTGNRIKIRGCGKTFKWSERIKIKWKAEKFIAYDAPGLINLLFNAVPYSPIIADEAFQILGGQNHNKSENKYLKEVLNNARPKKHIMFYCIPEVTWLDSKLREGFSSFWIRMVERGSAIIFEKDKGEAKDKYHMKELEKIFGTVKFFTPMEKIKRNVRKHPCYFDSITVPAVPAKVYDDYEMYRNSVLLQRQVQELALSNKDIAKIITWNIMNQWSRIKIAVDQSKEARPTYDILQREILIDPVSRKSLASEPTIRNWLKGVDDFVKTKGADALAFEGEVGAQQKDIEDDGVGIEITDDIEDIKEIEDDLIEL